MAQCQLHYQQTMPSVCLCCGAQATHLSRQTFINTNPWTLWTVPLGTWYYNKVLLQIPLCDAHRNTIRYRWVGPFSFLVSGGLLIFVTWGIYSSLYGREASDAAAGWIGGAVAIVFALFYMALLYVSFTRPHVSRVDGDLITLRKVSDPFAAAIQAPAAYGAFNDRGAAPILTAEIIDDAPGKTLEPHLPTAQLAASPRAGARKGLSWTWVALGGAALLFLFACGGGFGLMIGANLSYPVRIRVEAARGPMLMNGSTLLRVNYQAMGNLSDHDQYAWVVQHGNQTLRPRFASAFELRRGGVVEFHLFDPSATKADVWLECISAGGKPKRASNIARVKTG